MSTKITEGSIEPVLVIFRRSKSSPIFLTHRFRTGIYTQILDVYTIEHFISTDSVQQEPLVSHFFGLEKPLYGP